MAGGWQGDVSFATSIDSQTSEPICANFQVMQLDISIYRCFCANFQVVHSFITKITALIEILLKSDVKASKITALVEILHSDQVATRSAHLFRFGANKVANKTSPCHPPATPAGFYQKTTICDILRTHTQSTQ